jgi:hypothetical protein
VTERTVPSESVVIVTASSAPAGRRAKV